jgi:hypothetical protein
MKGVLCFGPEIHMCVLGRTQRARVEELKFM